MFMKKNDYEKNVDIFDVTSETSIFSGNEIIYAKMFMIGKLFKLMQGVENKILHGRIKDKESEKIRLDYFKAYVNACNCINNLTKQSQYNFDKDLLKNYLDNDFDFDDFDDSAE